MNNINKATLFYREILKNFTNDHIHKRSLKEINIDDCTLVHEKDNVKLYLNLDEKLTIITALFCYPNNDYLSSLMEITCRVIEGLPIKEVREHGVIRIENLLNPLMDTTVEGVALPTNYSVDFVWLNGLLINITDKLIKDYKINNKINTYYQRPTKAWLNKSIDQKKSVINNYIKLHKSSTNIKEKDVHLVKIANDHLFIEFSNCFSPVDKSIYCMELEKVIRIDYEFLIVFMERAQDISSLRRKINLK